MDPEEIVKVLRDAGAFHVQMIGCEEKEGYTVVAVKFVLKKDKPHKPVKASPAPVLSIPA